jgi:hypothetical protein
MFLQRHGCIRHPPILSRPLHTSHVRCLSSGYATFDTYQ